MITLGQRIAHYRKQAGLTQEELAEKCSVTPQAVSKWENDINAPDISLIPALAKLFGISCDELLGVRKEETQVVPQDMIDLNKVLLKFRAYSSEGDAVSLNLPLSVAELCLKSGAVGMNFDGNNILKNIDFAQIVSLVKSGVIGKIWEASSKDGDKVEIWVE